MSRLPDWNEDEFKIVKHSYRLSIGEIIQELLRCRPEVGRNRNAIGYVISGIHEYHQGQQNHGYLSRMMINILKQQRGHTKCPKCGVEF